MATNINTIDQVTAAQVFDDVSALLAVAIFNNPTLNLFNYDSEASIGDEAREFKWAEEIREEPYAQLDSSFTDTGAGGTAVVTVGTIANLKVGDHVHMDGHLDSAYKKVVHRVTAIASPNVTLVRVQGLQTNYTLNTTGNGRIHITRSIRDNATPGTAGVDEPSIITNFMQTFERPIEIGHMLQNLSQAELMYGFRDDDALARGLKQAIQRMVFDVDNAIWSGTGQGHSGSLAAYMKSIDTFVNVPGDTQIDCGAQPFEASFIDDLAVTLYRNGLMPGSPLMLVAHPSVIRLISNERKEDTTYDTFVPNLAFGGSVNVVSTMIGGFRVFLVPHPNLNAKVAYLLSQENVKLVPSRFKPPVAGTSTNMIPGIPPMLAWMVNATTPGQHGQKWVVRSELSLKVKHAAYWHGCFVNFTTALPESV